MRQSRRRPVSMNYEVCFVVSALATPGLMPWLPKMRAGLLRDHVTNDDEETWQETRTDWRRSLAARAAAGFPGAAVASDPCGAVPGEVRGIRNHPTAI